MAEKKSKVNYQSKVHKTKFKYGANDGTAAGTGGMDRRRKIDEIVDSAQSGKKKKKKS